MMAKEYAMGIPDPIAERKYLKELVRHSKETRRLFSNKHKPEREKMVCRAFLRCIGVDFHEGDLSIGPNEPIDITLGEAAFQITEVLDEGRRRSLEHREQETKYQNARSATDVMEPWKSPEPMEFPEMLSITAKRLEEKFDKLGKQGCRGIDALVYIDLFKPVTRYLFPEEFLQTDDVDKIRSHGWRSASVLIMPCATVLFATDAAPSFLRKHRGGVLRAPDEIVSRLFVAR
jgi:hypothetical protein